MISNHHQTFAASPFCRGIASRNATQLICFSETICKAAATAIRPTFYAHASVSRFYPKYIPESISLRNITPGLSF